MTTNNRFRCVILGEEGTLAARCGEALREAGHEILLVVTPTAEIRAWADGNGVAVIAPDDRLTETLAALSFDYLFSIANWRMLEPAVLAMPRRLAINYHDSLLPAYAGGNAPAWAIVNGETEHGITWHAMAEAVDAGDILVQRRFALAPDETTATLNARCYEAAVAGFRDLIEQLEASTLVAVPQDVAKASYYARYRKPQGGGVLDWTRTAVELERLVRACDTGGRRNPFALTKVMAGKGVWAVRAAEAQDLPVSTDPTTAIPGTVTSIAAGMVEVATGRGVLRLTRTEALDGSAEPLTEAVRKHGGGVGKLLPGLDPASRDALDAFLVRHGRHEVDWAQRLAGFVALDLIPPPRGETADDAKRFRSMSVPVPTGFGDRAMAALGLYLARLAGQDSVDLLAEPVGAEAVPVSLLVRQLPVHFIVPASASVTTALDALSAELAETRRRGGFLRDLLWRYPDLLGRDARMPTSPFWLAAGEILPQANTIVCGVTPNAIRFEIDTWRFDASAAEGLVRRFEGFLKALAASPDAPVSSICLLPADERAAVLESWNATACANDRDRPLVRRFESVAARLAGADALIDAEGTLSYGALDGWAGRIAAELLQSKVAPGDRVAILLDRGFALPTALIAAHKAGAAYVPLDPGHPDDRLAEVLRDSGATVLISAGTQLGRAKRLAAGIAVIDADGFRTGGAPQPVGIPLTSDDPAYVLYTSGSTGKPKGVVISHGNLTNYIDWAAREYPAAPGDVFPLFTSIAFDLTVTSIFVPLTTGGAVRVYPEDAPGTPPVVLDVFRDDAVDVVKLTPSHLALVLDAGLVPRRIHTLILGGEDLTRGLAEKVWRGFGERVTLCNEYGPTETTVGCMIHRFDPVRDTVPSVPIGRPAANVALYVLDGAGEPLPPSIAGELFVGGDGVGIGYLGRPDLTAERFLADPFRPGGRMYRTGDRVRWREDGVMEFLGRIDGQVKLRGVRIETGEVESRLLGHAEIASCVVELRAVAVTADETQHCTKCGLPDNYPNANFDASGVCTPCRSFERDRPDMERYFRTEPELADLFGRARLRGGKPANYDALMLYSGGKDSTYALYQLVREMGLNVLAFTFDNGFISDKAKENIANAVADLGIELVVGQTPSIDSIYRDSLERHATVCNGCFKTIYTMGINVARERGIRHIVTGLSRGQIFETRLADLFAQGVREPDEIEEAVLKARRMYHAHDDAVSRAFDVSYVRSDAAFEDIEFVDFYRYCGVGVSDIYDYINRHVRWVKPEAGGCSTNCVINDAGIFVHAKKRGFHNYAWPNSWEVRLGLKSRDEAIAELNAVIDEGQVRRILASIGYGLDAEGVATDRELVAYYRSRDGRAVPGLKGWLSRSLPDAMVPSHFVPMKEIPLTPNGKVDRKKLPPPGRHERRGGAGRAPVTRTERTLAGIWRELLRLDAAGTDDDFFALGGHSLSATRMTARLQEALGARLPLHIVMQKPRLGDLAASIDRMLEVRVPAAPAAAQELAGERREEGVL